MSDLYGVKVVVDPYMPDNEMLVVGDFEKPKGFTDWNEQEQLNYAVAHGAILVVKNVGSFSPKLPR